MKDIQLYDYQREMSERIEAAFRSCQSVMVQMPTGTGKTILLAEVVKREKGKVKNPYVWIVVHRRELVEQIRETLETMMSSFSTSGTTPSLLLYDSRIKVMSIQWLSRHYQEMEEIPSLIVIDEAHHAVAKTYKEVMDAFPEAKKLGLTATPCRLTRRGFTDLFDVLLQSWSAKKFIADGWLSLYDYMSIKEDSEDWHLVNSLKKRGADGDFSLRDEREAECAAKHREALRYSDEICSKQERHHLRHRHSPCGTYRRSVQTTWHKCSGDKQQDTT